MIVLDADVLIAHLDAEDAQHARARSLLELHAAEDLGASVLTLAETLVFPAREGRLGRAARDVARLDIVPIPIDEAAPAQLASLRAQTGLKLPDCCVLLAAQVVDADTVLTFDKRLAGAARELGFATI